MAVVFADQWLSHGAEHVKSKEKALALIGSAVKVLERTEQLEFWNFAAAAVSAAPTSQGTFLRVFKDAHQNEGLFGQHVHLTISLKRQAASGEYPHSMYGGAFHLYIEVLDPLPGKTKYQLKPTRLSYRAAQGDVKNLDLAGCAEVDSDKG